MDLHDVARLTEVLRRGQSVFALDPPGEVSGDTDAEEDRTGEAILAATAGSGVDQVGAASTYGAQAGRGIGDLGTLYAFEQGLAALPVPVTVVRSAFYLSNDNGSLASAREDGRTGSSRRSCPATGRSHGRTRQRPLPWSHPRTSADWRPRRRGPTPA